MLRRVMVVLWPAFLAAIVAEGFFFSMFAPGDLLALLGRHDTPDLAVYTLGFFLFWLCCSLASWLTYYLAATLLPHDPPF